MSEKRKAAPGVTSTRSGKMEAAAGAAASHSYNSTDGGPIASVLSTGKQNAMTARQIAQISGNKPRDVTRCIQKERAAGTAICASGDGFFMAADAQELGRYIRAFDERLREMQKTRRGLEVAYCRMTGQKTLEGFQ